MTLIGLELNDTGILAAGGSPLRLLELDGQVQESPGFALPQKKGLLVGKNAESKAHLFPRQIQNHFWDQLNSDPLEHNAKYFPLNHAEIVYRHLSLIWQQLKSHGDEIVMAVPSFYDREQLGLILGIAQELGMPLKGFVPLALAASSQASPDKMLLHLDIHLYRIEVIYLEQGEHLTLRDSATSAEKGMLHLYRTLVDMIAQEFVRTTRFDPFHRADSEQELYDRLPGILSHFQHNSSMVFEIAGGATAYSITLERDRIIHKAESVYREIIRLIKRMQNKRGKGQTSLVLQLSHRLSRLPGCKKMLATLKGVQIIELDRGAAASNIPKIWHQLTAQNNNEGISFFTSRPWQPQEQTKDHQSSAEKAVQKPTHLLYHSIAYPITDKPLYIVSGPDRADNDVTIIDEPDSVFAKQGLIEFRGSDIVLNVIGDQEIFIDEKRINGSITLKLGQIIRIGTPGEQLQVIACLNSSPEK